MSQDHPSPPEPGHNQSPQPDSQGRDSQGSESKLLEQVVQLMQQTGRRLQPILQFQSIRVLRGTIRILEGLLTKLESGLPEGASPPEVPVPQSSVVSEVGPEMTSSPPGRSPALSRQLQDWLPKLKSLSQQLWTAWIAILGRLRPRLPTVLNQLPDSVLSGAIAGVLLVMFWVIQFLLPGPAVKVATQPTPAVPPLSLEQPLPPVNDAVEAPAPLEAAGPGSEVAESAPAIPSELAAPPAVAVTPALPILSPEEILLASLEAKVAGLIQSYDENLFEGIQANLPDNQLRVQLSDRWYEIEPLRQDQLTGELWQQSQEMDFKQLQIIDSQGNLIARSPVIGSEMVIVQRISTTVGS